MSRRRENEIPSDHVTAEAERAAVEARLEALEDRLGAIREIRVAPPASPMLDSLDDLVPHPHPRTRETLTIETAETLARLRALEARLSTHLGDPR